MKEKDTENTQLTTEDFDSTNRGYDEMTEEEFENATDEVQVRHLIEINKRGKVRNRDDVEKKFELKVGVKDTGFDMNDTRRVLKLYKIPDGYWYRVDDPNVGYSEVSKEQPDFDVYVDDAVDFVNHAVKNKQHKINEAVEFTYVEDSFRFRRLKPKISIEIRKHVEE